jgi:hypothetical protein
VLYGIGARLDDQPELLFRLREVAEMDLIAQAGGSLSLSRAGPAPGRLLPAEGLSELFGLDMATAIGEPEPTRASRKRARGRRSPKAPARVKEVAPVAKTRGRRASPPKKKKKKKRTPKPGARALPQRKAKQPSAPG